MKKAVKHICAAGAALAAAGQVAAVQAEDAAAAVSWRLAPDARVDSSGIFLSQVVIPTPPVALPQIRLAPAPLLGQTISFSRDQIMAMAQTNLAGLYATNWSGPPRIKIQRRSRELDEAGILSLLTSVIQSNYVKDQGELELHLSHPWTPATVPDEALILTVSEIPAAGLNPVFLAGFDLWNGTERVGRWQLVVQAKVWKMVPVAHSKLTRGELLRGADLTLDRRDMLVQRDVLTELPGSDCALELTENVATGMAVNNRAVRPRPVIKRGQLVEAVFEEGSLKISLKVETLEDGAVGQTVRVRNPKTRRELYGKVQNEERISITL